MRRRSVKTLWLEIASLHPLKEFLAVICLDDLNTTLQEIRDAVLALANPPIIGYGGSTDLFLQQSSVILVSGTQRIGFTSDGNQVHIQAVLSATSNGTIGNVLQLQGVPDAAFDFAPIGSALLVNAGVISLANVLWDPAGYGNFHTDGSSGSGWGVSPSAAFVIGDSLYVNLLYELGV